MAELSRPECEHSERVNQKQKKPQGRKKLKQPQDAKYMNWHAPFVWPQILKAANSPAVGWKMSTSVIHDELRRMNPEVFQWINHNTIEHWIDRTGPRPRWSERALLMAEREPPRTLLRWPPGCIGQYNEINIKTKTDRKTYIGWVSTCR